MKTSVSTFSFAAGILSPELAGNIELNKNGLGVLEADNLYVTSSGTLSKRPGTKYIAEAKGPCRLIPFVFNRSQGYNLEFGNNYIRFFRDGGQLVDGGSPVEISSPYTFSEVGEIRFTQSADVLFLTHPSHPPKKLTRVTDTDWTLSDMVFVPDVEQVLSLAVSHTGTPTVNFDWEYTVTVTNTLGQEGQPVASVSDTADIDLNDTPITVTWDKPTDVSEVKHYNVYRKKGIYFYLVAIVQEDGSPSYSKLDSGLEADATVSPPEDFTGFATAGDYPTACGFYQQRLVFGGSDNDPNRIWMSRIADYENFTNTPTKASNEAFEGDLDSGEVNKIKHFKMMDDLITFTEGDIWRVKGVPNVDLLTYVESTIGTSSVDPIKTRKSLLFLEANEKTVSDFIYSDKVSGYDGDDLGAFSKGLFDGYTISDFSFSDAPEGRMYAVRSDGTILSLTYLKSQKISAWTELQTDGFVESICVVPKAQNDEVYISVLRDGGRYIEILADQFVANQDIQEAWYVDSGAQYDGTKTTEIVITAGDVVSAVDVFVSTNVGDNIVINDTDYEILTYTDAKNVTVVNTLTITTSDWILTSDKISGLTWLANQTAAALCDGDAYNDLSINASGEVDLPDTYKKVTIGLPFTALMKTIPVNLISNNFGSTLGRTKKINKLYVDLYRSRGIEWKTTMEGDEFQELPEQDNLALNEEIELTSEKVPLDLLSTNDESQSVIVRNTYPTPFNVLNTTIHVSIEGAG